MGGEERRAGEGRVRRRRPVDDCTFWYTNEYLSASASYQWQTRIGHFKLSGCGSPPSPDFSLSASPSSQTVVQGATATYSVTVATSGGYAGSPTLSVSGLPPGAAGSFNPNPTSSTSTLTVTTSTTATTGSFPLTITGVDGSLTHSTGVTLVVNPPAPPPQADFALSASPSSRVVTRGGTATYTVTVAPSNGFTGSVVLGVTGCPTNATCQLSPSSAPSTLTVTTSSSTPLGTRTLTITGTSGSLSHTTTVTVQVKQK